GPVLKKIHREGEGSHWRRRSRGCVNRPVVPIVEVRNTWRFSRHYGANIVTFANLYSYNCVVFLIARRGQGRDFYRRDPFWSLFGDESSPLVSGAPVVFKFGPGRTTRSGLASAPPI